MAISPVTWPSDIKLWPLKKVCRCKTNVCNSLIFICFDIILLLVFFFVSSLMSCGPVAVMWYTSTKCSFILNYEKRQACKKRTYNVFSSITGAAIVRRWIAVYRLQSVPFRSEFAILFIEKWKSTAVASKRNARRGEKKANVISKSQIININQVLTLYQFFSRFFIFLFVGVLFLLYCFCGN